MFARDNQILAAPADFPLAEGETGLKIALDEGLRHRGRSSITKGADINTTADESGASAVLLAVALGDADPYRHFIEAGAHVSVAMKDGSNLVLLAVVGRKLVIIRDVLSRGLNINTTPANEDTALHVALLLASGANKSVKDGMGKAAADRTKSEAVKAPLR